MRGLAMAVVVVALAAATPATGRAWVPEPAPSAPVSRGEGLRVQTRAVYRVDPKGTTVHVEVTSTLTNQSPDTASFRTYFHSYGFPVVSEAVNVSARRADGTALTTRRESTDLEGLVFVVVDLQPNIFFGETMTVTLAYDIPDQPPRADVPTRANGAYVSFPVFSAGDPGLTDIVVNVPDTFEAEVIGSEMTQAREDGVIRFEALAIDDPFAFTAFVSARDDDKLIDREVDVDEAEITVRAWPNDARWADFAAETLREGLPELIELLGLPWPVDDRVEVVENATTYLEGYAGWYLLDEDVIEVGDQLDRATLLHELSHAWFNNELFLERWVNEGLADEASFRVMRRLDEEAQAPRPIDTRSPARLPLNSWDDPSFLDESSVETERYGYDTSFAVIHAIVQEIGADRLAPILKAADARTIPYAGDPEPEEVPGRPSWKRLLDLAQEVGGSRTAASLFDAHVVSADDRDLLAERSEARRAYAALEDAGDGWTPPYAVRAAMTAWRFDDASELIAAADAALAVRDDIERALADTDVSLEILESSFESVESFDTVRRQLDEAAEAAAAIADADDALDDVGVLGALGVRLFGGEGDLDDATLSFQSGFYEDARTAALSASDIANSAVLRSLVTLLVIAAAVALVVVVVRALRRHTVRTEDRERTDGAPRGDLGSTDHDELDISS